MVLFTDKDLKTAPHCGRKNQQEQNQQQRANECENDGNAGGKISHNQLDFPSIRKSLTV